MRIEIEALRFEAIIGLLAFERITPQELIININIEYTFINEFIDYAKVSEVTKIHIKEKKFLLIEEALLSLSKELIKKFPLIGTLYLKITKPSILPDCSVSVSDFYRFES